MQLHQSAVMRTFTYCMLPIPMHRCSQHGITHNLGLLYKTVCDNNLVNQSNYATIGTGRTGKADRLELRVGAHGESIAGGEPVGRQLAAGTAIDDLAEERALDLDLIFLKVDVPAASRPTPAVAPRLE